MHNHIRKSIVGFCLFLILIGVYIMISIFFIIPFFGNPNYDDEINDMKVFALSTVNGENREENAKFDIISESLVLKDVKEGTFNITIRSDSDIRLSVQYPVHIIKREIVIDENNVKYSISNTNLSGCRLIVAVVLILIYIKIMTTISKYYENKKH